MMFAVFVTFQIAPDRMDKFMTLMLENARTSLRKEPDCHQFDVLTDSTNPNAVSLYELYTNKDAFTAHLASKHFRVFDAAATPMIASKTVQTWDQVEQ